MPDGVRCPHCEFSRLHRDGYTEKGAAKYHCLNCHGYLNDLTNSVLAFVREVQEIAEKIEEGTILKDLIEIDVLRRERRELSKIDLEEGGLRRKVRQMTEINHQCRHLLKGVGKTRFFVKMKLSRSDTKKDA